MAMKRWGTSCSQQSNLAGFQAIQASRIFPHCEFFRDKNYQAKTSINIYTYVYMIIYVYIYMYIPIYIYHHIPVCLFWCFLVSFSMMTGFPMIHPCFLVAQHAETTSTFVLINCRFPLFCVDSHLISGISYVNLAWSCDWLAHPLVCFGCVIQPPSI